MKNLFIRIRRIFSLIILLSFGNWGADSVLKAQTPNSTNKPSKLYMQVRTVSLSDKNIAISWTPLDTLTFKQGFVKGYTLSRYDSTTNQTTLLSDHILPKDTSVFSRICEMDTTMASYYATLSYWLYTAKDSPDVRLRYNQIISNGHDHPQTAVLTGLGWIDSTVLAADGRYRYDLKLNDSDVATQVNVERYSIFVSGNNGVPFPTFEFGDDAPLRTAMPQIKPIKVFAVAKAFGDSVFVRWSPDSYNSWVRANKQGYEVKRREITEKGLSDSSRIIGIFKPLPIDSFAQEPRRSDTGCIIAAQALYGENMQISADASLMDKATQAEMRFTIAAQAGDKSFRGAQALGLGTIDYTVEKGKSYSYTVTPLEGGIPTSVFVTNMTAEQDAPIDFKAKQGDHIINLNWSFENQKKFSMYRIYRSDDDGINYTPLTPEPIAYLLKGDEPDTFRYSFNDSIPVNYKRFKYRLQGLDMFATWSSFAEVEAFGIDLRPPARPLITEGRSTVNSLDITWAVDSVDTDLAGFQVFMGNSAEGEYTPLTKLLPTDTRQYTHRDSVSLTRSYYFKVRSIDTAGNIAESGAYFVIVIDSIPPATPLSFRGKISKTGIVRLIWQHGTEPDLVGYRVFSSTNNRDFRLLTDSPIDSNAYQDTLPLNTLNKKMYYQVLAEDQNGNKSPYSIVVTIQKPDTIVPVMPVMAQPESGGKGITLKWVPSSSNDVMAHLLYRKPDKDTIAKWTLIQTLDGRAEWFTDTTAFIEQPYVYYMVAQDSAENISEQSLIVGGRRFFDGKSGGIQTLNAAFDKDKKNIQVSWQTAPTTDPFLKNKDYFIFIYRGLANAPLEKYQQVEGKKLTAFTDDEVSKGQYRYALCVVYDDGKMTPLTQEVLVDIE